jgi:hypothetical protein
MTRQQDQWFKNNQGARVRSKSPARGGKRSQSREEQTALGSWFLVVSGNLVMEDEPVLDDLFNSFTFGAKITFITWPRLYFGGLFGSHRHSIAISVKGCDRVPTS